MNPRPSARRTAALLATLALAGSFFAAGQSSAQAATPQPGVRVAATPSGPAGTITFTRAARPGLAPAASFSCSVTYPYVTDTFSTGEFSWSAAVGCSISLQMQGTTVLYQWGSSNAFAFGSSYNNYSSYNTSSGTYYGIHSGQWGVNNNVLITIPAGWTTTVNGGCYYANSTQIHCTAITGPITAQ